MTKCKRNMLLFLLTASVALLLVLVFLCAFRRTVAVASAEDVETSYTTTNRLYLDLPNRNLSFELITKGGTVNDIAETVQKKREAFRVHGWYSMYIELVGGGTWNVEKSAIDADGNYYYDAAKHALKSGQRVNVYLDVKTPQNGNSLKPFIWNDTDVLFHRKSNSDARLEWHTGSGLGEYTPLVFKCGLNGAAMQDIQIKDAVSYDKHKCNKGTNDWHDEWWTIDGPDDFTTGFGIQPETKTHFLGAMPAGKVSLYISFLFGGAAKGWTHGRGQTAHFVMPNSSYRYARQIELDLSKTDDVAPSIKLSEEHAKTKITASWMDSSYAYATYTYNGEAMGEYTSGAALKDEGVYTITATDAVGNSSRATAYVDKTAPRFSEEFYAADGTPLTVYTDAKEYVLPFPTNTARESPIVSRATYVRSYYDSAAKRVISLPAEYYNRGDKLTKEGRYAITVSDAAGNSSTCTVIIDRTPPQLTASPYSMTAANAKFSYTEVESPISASYVFTDASGTAAPKSYASGMQLYAEGKYIITATDAVGNSSSVTAYVDKTSPILACSFEYGKTAGLVAYYREEWESPVSAVYSYIGAHGERSDIPYVSEQKLIDDGEYTVTATDGAGNVTSIKLTVDSKAPVLTFGDGTSGTSQITRASSSVAWSVERYESPVQTVMSFKSADEQKAPSTESAPYLSGKTFTAEGTYSFTSTDAAGNVTNATVIIDCTPPTLGFSAGGARFEKFANASFVASGDDMLSGVETIEIYENGRYVAYDFLPRSDNGAYMFRITDKAGNVTSKTATVYATDTYGNFAAIRDGYKVNSWYVVALPARIFTTPSCDIAGRYSFESYENALAFAIEQERAFRVTTLPDGYMYVAATNEAVAQKYDTLDAVNAVVEKYAKGYISARQTAKENGSDKYYTEPDSLVRNSPTLPDYLYDYKDVPHVFSRASFNWIKPKLAYIADMRYTVVGKYLGDVVGEESAQEFVIERSATLASAAPDYRQGWYLITESDEAGNVERYLVYSDAELPTVSAAVLLGDREGRITLDYEYTKNETMYFISLDISELSDNVDDFVTLKIQRGNSSSYFTQSDELPTLGSDEFPSGKYTITVFDRSLNALIFDVFIAGMPPSMTHGSLDADKTECKLSFVMSDKYNVITGITLYKIEYDGTKTVLDTDGLGVTVSPETLSYTLTAGGKYGATVTDNYRRTVELDPVFFLKGLPSGKISGVKPGDRTNNNVSITFDSADVCELFTLSKDGTRQPFKDYTVQTGAAQTMFNIEANDATSFEYLVFLHNADDLSLFVEYEFEIDTVLPEFRIVGQEGNIIEPDGATNKPFSLSWNETGVSVRYYTARSGQLGAVKYNMNSVLSQGTLYYFTLKDAVGNSRDFTVLLDNVVDYTISGKYNEVDGVMYANSPLTFTVNEPTQVFKVQNADGYTIDNGGTLTHAGRYDIIVADNYGNTAALCIVLDFTPPMLELVGVENGGAVKDKVSVIAEDYDYLYISDAKGNKLKDISSGDEFSSSGKYYITALDYAGNSTTVSFSIDLSVDYTLSVPNGAVTTDAVALDTTEPLTVDVRLNGERIDMARKFSVIGTYELTLTDELGNRATCEFIIVAKRIRTISLVLPFGTRIVSALKDGIVFDVAASDKLELEVSGQYDVLLDCGGVQHALSLTVDNTPPVVTITKDDGNVKISAVDKADAMFKLTIDGEKINCRVGQKFDEPGHYVLTVTDDLGNESVYKWDIPFRLNVWAIVAIVVGGIVLIVILALFIRARRSPRLK